MHCCQIIWPRTETHFLFYNDMLRGGGRCAILSWTQSGRQHWGPPRWGGVETASGPAHGWSQRSNKVRREFCEVCKIRTSKHECLRELWACLLFPLTLMRYRNWKMWLCIQVTYPIPPANQYQVPDLNPERRERCFQKEAKALPSVPIRDERCPSGWWIVSTWPYNHPGGWGWRVGCWRGSQHLPHRNVEKIKWMMSPHPAHGKCSVNITYCWIFLKSFVNHKMLYKYLYCTVYFKHHHD